MNELYQGVPYKDSGVWTVRVKAKDGGDKIGIGDKVHVTGLYEGGEWISEITAIKRRTFDSAYCIGTPPPWLAE